VFGTMISVDVMNWIEKNGSCLVKYCWSLDCGPVAGYLYPALFVLKGKTSVCV
jgi:hypothetical protein